MPRTTSNGGLTAFLVTEAHQSEKGGFRFFVGILDAKGIERARVELSSDEVLAALYSWIRVTVMSDAKGEIVPCPFGIPEKMLDRLFADGGLTGRTIDELTREAIEFSFNEPRDTFLADLAKFHGRLQHSLQLVDEALGHRRDLDGTSGHRGGSSSSIH